MQSAAVAALSDALAELGVEGSSPAESSGPDFAIRQPDGSVVVAEVKATAVPSWEWVSKLNADVAHMIVVADQIPVGIRQQLNDRGIAWLDRRGHLRLVGGGFFIDADIPSTARAATSKSDRAAISGRSGLAAAAALLLHPDDPIGVTEISRLAALNVSSISRAMAALAEAQLAERLGRGRYRPLVPELFWALAEVWPRDRTVTGLTIGDLDRPQLGVGVDAVSSIGWAMAGERGAVSWGAPLVLTGDYPAFFYVLDEVVIRTVRALHPEKDQPAQPGITLAVDPTGLIVSNRFRSPAGGLPLAHPLFCALDLAAASRDREALEQWTPPEGFTRVW